MKKLALILLLINVLCSCNKDNEITPSGSVTRIEKVFTDFSSVETSDGLDIIFTFNNSERVEVETNENIQSYIVATKVGNKLVLKKMDNVNFATNTVVKIYISAKKINEIIASGGCDVSSTNMYEIDNLNAVFSGGSNFTADLKCNTFNLTTSGGSNTFLTGTADLLTINSKGGSDFNDFNFIVKKFTCDASGGGEVNLTVNEKLDVTASGGSTINYKGTGVVGIKNLTGGSQLIKK